MENLLSKNLRSLSEEELECFPTLRDLVLDCFDSDPKFWGLRRHKKNKSLLSFGTPNTDWELIESLSVSIQKAQKTYGEMDLSNFIFWFGRDHKGSNVPYDFIFRDQTQHLPSPRRQFVRMAMH